MYNYSVSQFSNSSRDIRVYENKLLFSVPDAFNLSRELCLVAAKEACITLLSQKTMNLYIETQENAEDELQIPRSGSWLHNLKINAKDNHKKRVHRELIVTGITCNRPFSYTARPKTSHYWAYIL
jgi:hypothetical protein